METYELSKSKVEFNSGNHTYLLAGKRLRGVTGIVAWMFPETYLDIPAQTLNAAAKRGKAIHAACEMYDNLGLMPTNAPREAHEYRELCAKWDLISVANEYLISDNENIASCIDVVMQHSGYEADEFCLADIKTTSTIHYDNVRLQLSIYAYLFELNNAGASVRRILTIWLPKEQYGAPTVMDAGAIMEKSACEEIIRAYLAGEPNTEYRKKYFPETGVKITSVTNVETSTLPEEVIEAEKEIIKIEATLRDIKAREDELKAGLLKLMKANGVKKYESESLIITYVAPTKRYAFDSALVKSVNPDLYNTYLKETETKESIRIKVKEQ